MLTFMKKIKLLVFAITLSSCVSSLNKCPTYSLEYECIDDGDKGYAVVPIVYNIGDTIVSPRSGHRLKITKITFLNN